MPNADSLEPGTWFLGHSGIQCTEAGWDGKRALLQNCFSSAYLKGSETERIVHPLDHSKQTGLSQAKGRSQEPRPDLPRGWQGTQQLESSPVIPGVP